MNSGTTRGGSDAESGESTWPPYFPHSEIDALVNRLKDASNADANDAIELLQAIAREAQRLRSAVIRLSVERLAAAEHEANEIVSAAQDRANSVRALALQTVDNRLDEAEQLQRSMRRAFLVEHHLSGNTGGSLRSPEGGAAR